MIAKNILIISDSSTLQEIISEQFYPQDGYHIRTQCRATLSVTDELHLLIIDDCNGSDIRLPEYIPTIDLCDNPAKITSIHHHLAKPFSLQPFLSLIHQLTSEIKESPILLADGYYFSTNSKLLNKNDVTIDLTEKETALIKYLYEANGKAVSKAELLQSIWQYDKNADTHTLETHIYRLRQKIAENGGNDSFIITEISGYRLHK